MKLIPSVLCLVLAGAVEAQAPASAPAAPSKPISTSLGVVVFPAKGQTPQQQGKDEGECFTWSKGQTGVDPTAPPPPPPAAVAQEPAQKAGGERARGAARGAAAGAVVGEIANDDASEGAAIGAAAGAMKGGSQKRKNKAEAQSQAEAATQQQAADQKAAHQQQLDLFNKGFGACMEGRGYTVK